MTREEALSLLLDEGVLHKLTAGGNLAQAEALLSPVADAGGVLGALGAYRLGHVLLRLGRTEEADARFSRASRARCLGPWPSIYRLAVAVQQGQATTRHWERAVESLDDDPEEQLQTGAVNALEVLAAAVDPGRLEALGGRGVLPDAMSATWVFLRRPGSVRRVTEAMAQGLAADESDRLVLILGAESLINGERLPPALASTLAWRLLNPEWDRPRLRSAMGVEVDPFRQRIRQLRTRLPGGLDEHEMPCVPLAAAIDQTLFSR